MTTEIKSGTSAKWNNDYEPYENRNLDNNGLTRVESLMHVIKGCIGTGLLALPEAFYFAGMINGIMCFIILSIFGTYCFHIMVRSQYHLCKYKKVGLLTYPDAMVVAFEVGPECLKKCARLAWHLTNIFFILYQVGVLCVYVIFTAANLKLVCDQYTEDPIPLWAYNLMIVVPCILVICIKNLKGFVPFSIFANIVTFAALGVIAYYASRDLPPFSDRPAFGEVKNFPLSFGTSIFALLSVPVVISIENAMADGKYFLAAFGTLNVGFGIVAGIYTLVAIMGYWRYGEEINSTITLNFPPQEIVAQTIRILYCIAIVISYGLNGIVPVQIIWDGYIQSKLEEKETSERRMIFYEYLLRLGICVFTFIFSITISQLGPVISLVGGVSLSALGVIFPALLEICALWPDGFGKFRWIFWKDILIGLIGLLGLVSSTYASIRDIVIALSLRSSFEK